MSFALSQRYSKCIEYAGNEKWKTLYTENSTTSQLSQTLNGSPNLWTDSWTPGRKIRIEWETDKYIEFLPESNIFVDRSTTNKIIQLEEFSTSDSSLASWVEDAGGAIFCISKSDGRDSAWGIKDQNDQFFDNGCNSGSWNGRGAFYDDDFRGGGWTGVTDNGEAKGGFNLGITIKMKQIGKLINVLN